MCGIIGYVGPKPAKDILIEGLEKLKYRGYDSAGLAVATEGALAWEKKSCHLDQLLDAVADQAMPGHTGIAHTRWATHGAPTDANAHPHISPNGTFAVVHNGIIENAQALRETYVKDKPFRSETDTEIIVQLMEHFDSGNLFDDFRQVIGLLEGSYALALISQAQPDQIMVARKGNPMIIGLGQGETFIGSDAMAFLAHTRQVVYLEGEEIGLVTADGIQIFDRQGQEIDLEIEEITWDEEAAQKDGYPHFMLKEIHEQPTTFQQVMADRLFDDRVDFEEFQLTTAEAAQWTAVHMVACGTAYHSGLVAKPLFEKFLGIPVTVEVASEFRYRDPLVDDKTLVIAISQSGETSDTLEAMWEAKRRGATVIAICNVVGSTISREADEVLYLWSGPEISVASTKAYTAMLIALILLALYLGDRSGRTPFHTQVDLIQELAQLPEGAQDLLTPAYLEEVKALVPYLSQADDIFYLGRGIDWAIAEEGALKLKEITYIHAEAYPAGELKHGTLALIDAKTPVVAVALQEATYEKTMSNVKEVTARQAPVLALVQASMADQARDHVQGVLTIPDGSGILAPILAAIPLQLLAYETAKALGREIDTPRNLAKSVTVE